MGFDLTGYEEDSMDIMPIVIYSILGLLAVALVIFAIYFYMFLLDEKFTQEMFLERDTKQTLDYNKAKVMFLESNELERGMEKALNRYND
ncbi:MAG: hypothetical protein CMF91_04540 [Candidatus Marinimicrobia bacterium]|nr:hypothetical protein [Candidatus Neomarinimicrobiota bacterium]|tara:strand:- start:503 stop:772 length:270 start_codon:yes stop_codon:yes gene_type:complete